MYVEVDADEVEIEVRCSECDSAMEIVAQYEYDGVITVEVRPCEECGGRE